ncbi:MAG: 2-dehydropantoate 2-reductase [SAR202 cluster bacterium]|nr:2-dehydropantoate 2-reductase [SAR202 cluster bacterium]
MPLKIKKNSKKIGVIGVGAIGGTIGGPLTKAGYDVTLIDQWPENVNTMKQRGLRVSGTHGDQQIPVKALHLSEVSALNPRFDWIFICVKSYDTKWATQFVLSYLKSDGAIVSAQNSINEDWICPIAGYTRVLSCILTLGGAMYEPANALRTNEPEALAITVGELHGRVTPRLEELAQMMSAVGITKTTSNTWGERWAKLAVNCMVNPMAGITGLSSAEVRRNPATRRILIRAAAEAIRVGQALGITVEPINGIPAQKYLQADSDAAAMEDVETEMAFRSKERGEGLPSMLQDLMKKRRTEIDYLNGYVVEKGKQANVPTPINEAITSLLTRVERQGLKPDISNLRPLERYN